MTPAPKIAVVAIKVFFIGYPQKPKRSKRRGWNPISSLPPNIDYDSFVSSSIILVLDGLSAFSRPSLLLVTLKMADRATGFRVVASVSFVRLTGAAPAAIFLKFPAARCRIPSGGMGREDSTLGLRGRLRLVPIAVYCSRY